MKLSQVIRQLQEMKQNHGDREVLKLVDFKGARTVQRMIVTISDPDGVFMTFVPTSEIYPGHEVKQ